MHFGSFLLRGQLTDGAPCELMPPTQKNRVGSIMFKNFPSRVRNCGLICACVLGYTIGSTNPARATLLVYDGFNYADGSVLTNASALGAGDSFGWGGRWTGAN